jgi:hypothetical protein
MENRDVNLRSNLKSFLEEDISVFRNIYLFSQDGLELIVTITEKLEVLEKQGRYNHQK